MSASDDAGSSRDGGGPGSVLVGVFARRADAEDAVFELQSAGWTDEQIGFVAGDEALVAVWPGDRYAEAHVILQRNGGEVEQA